MNRERELIKKGYRIHKIFEGHRSEAYAYAKRLRAMGYFAQVIEQASNVIGWHDFVVYAKPKKR